MLVRYKSFRIYGRFSVYCIIIIFRIQLSFRADKAGTQQHKYKITNSFVNSPAVALFDLTNHFHKSGVNYFIGSLVIQYTSFIFDRLLIELHQVYQYFGNIVQVMHEFAFVETKIPSVEFVDRMTDLNISLHWSYDA